MRFLWSLLVLFGLTLVFVLPAEAEPIFRLRELSVDSNYQDDGPLRKNYSVITWENIEWFLIETNLKVYDDPRSQKYSRVQNRISFPGNDLMRNLYVEWQRDEAKKYCLDEWGAEYRIQLFPNWIVGLSAEDNTRFPKYGLSFYRQNQQEIYTKFRFKSFVYSFSYNHLDKKDETAEYTHQSNQLYQTLTWVVGSGWDISVFNEEKAGDYPEALNKNAISQEWGIKGNWRGKRGSRLFWSYAATDLLHGYSVPGRDEELRLGGVYPLTDTSSFSLTLVAKDHESFQINPELADADEIITDNQKSYRDFKATLEYKIRGPQIIGKIDCWLENKEYYQDSKYSGVTPGFSGSLILKMKPCALTARISQTGAGEARHINYQLSVDIKP